MFKLLSTILLLLVLEANFSSAGKNVVCYLGTWANYRPGAGKFTIENIDPTICTHLIYSFFGINADGTVAILDSYLDLPDNFGLNAIGRFNGLKKQNPSFKTIAAIGGWNWGSSRFSTVAKSATLRSKFATEARAFCQKYGFDGIDIDWEYPAQRDGDTSVDKANFVLMLKDLNTELKKYGLLLTVAVGAAESSASVSYDIPQISNYVDFINLMEYDFHMASDGITGHNAPLYAGTADVTATQKQLNVFSSVQYWLSKGAPAAKLNLGMPLYGRTYTLASATNNGVGAPVTGAGAQGPYTREAGYVGYNEICERKLTGTWTEVFDNLQMVPYTYSGNQWVGFDNVKSITEKCNFIKNNGLAGGMFWSIETDDFLGNCGPKFGLISTLKSCLGTSTGTGSSATTTTTPTTVTTTTTKQPITTTTTKATTSGSFTCTSTGYFRDPVDCTKFYYCQGTYRYDFVCPAGLYFVPATVICDYPQNVKCP